MNSATSRFDIQAIRAQVRTEAEDAGLCYWDQRWWFRSTEEEYRDRLKAVLRLVIKAHREDWKRQGRPEDRELFALLKSRVIPEAAGEMLRRAIGSEGDGRKPVQIDGVVPDTPVMRLFPGGARTLPSPFLSLGGFPKRSLFRKLCQDVLVYFEGWVRVEEMNAMQAATGIAASSPVPHSNGEIGVFAENGERKGGGDAPEKPKAKARRNGTLSKRERTIRDLIRRGIKGLEYAEQMDAAGHETPESWQCKDKNNPCPRRHVGAYKNPIWKEQIQKEKSRVNARMKRKK